MSDFPRGPQPAPTGTCGECARRQAKIERLQAVVDAARKRATTIIEDAIYPREAKGVAWQILRALDGKQLNQAGKLAHLVKPCPMCHGSGWVGSHAGKPCPACGGAGRKP